jgi:hypothetical protein
MVPGGPVQVAAPANATMRRRLDVIPPVSLRFVSDVQLFAPGAARPVTVELAAARARVGGTVQSEGPAGWRITAASQPFHLAGAGERARFTFTVTAPAQLATAILEGSVRWGRAVQYAAHRASLRPHSVSAPPAVARLKAVSLDLAIRGGRVGYLPGAGDDVAACLERMAMPSRVDRR